jgi:hypothetical protein
MELSYPLIVNATLSCLIKQIDKKYFVVLRGRRRGKRTTVSSLKKTNLLHPAYSVTLFGIDVVQRGLISKKLGDVRATKTPRHKV